MVEYPDAPFKEEYIVPQMLLQWVANDNYLDGIRYESCSSANEVRALGGHNLVFVSKEFDKDGYDIKLRKTIQIGLPKQYDIYNLEIDPELISCLNGKKLQDTPFLWGMESISNDYRTF